MTPEFIVAFVLFNYQGQFPPPAVWPKAEFAASLKECQDLAAYKQRTDPDVHHEKIVPQKGEWVCLQIRRNEI